MERVNSRDTFSTLIENEEQPSQDDLPVEDTSDLISLISSQDTLINPTIKIMNQNITNFTRIYTLPLISNFLHTGVYLYLNWNDIILNKPPLLSRSSTKFTIFKKTPLLIIHKHDPLTNNKEEFCKVEFKIHSIHITYYILEFPTLNNLRVYLINNNSLKPTVDFIYNDSNFRIFGITGTTSALGTSPEMKLYVMPNESNNLLTYNNEFLNNGKKIKIDNKLSKLINNQEQSKINQLLNDEKPMVDIPLARYLDQRDVKIKIDTQQKHIIKHGIIKMFDWKDNNSQDDNNNDVSDDMLVICCIMLVLREQEYRKFKGG
ncbi:conserved hypothetical protein [Candida tropicalis MYA-3404]|uniref:Uncharacterized protein n=1 Tax=Candida tropicalis (strain ATCC MYA-3404 / T1) TaxID=294747 RepID=C5M8X3_CANTT|nr:conserved hypothetical protein [Candida tropicalis MYA-3404]EER34027.1 conserved hypothetical protein [Candida tropicalis MYA-3404]KAG4407884.1 hypothetical protein JTP64_003420 [Candida tropicalis]MCP8716084.1 hypothetical protein [Asgard group archaeon]